MPIIVYVHTHLVKAYFKARGVRKYSVPDMIKIELINIPVKSGIVYPDVDGFLYVVLRPDDLQLWLNESLSKNNQQSSVLRIIHLQSMLSQQNEKSTQVYSRNHGLEVLQLL